MIKQNVDIVSNLMQILLILGAIMVVVIGINAIQVIQALSTSQDRAVEMLLLFAAKARSRHE